MKGAGQEISTWTEDTFYTYIEHLGHLSCLLIAKIWVYAADSCAKNQVRIQPLRLTTRKSISMLCTIYSISL